MRTPFAGLGSQYPKPWAAGAVSNLGDGVSVVAGPQEGAQRPWWGRMFGG
jgi:hypothetical protein